MFNFWGRNGILLDPGAGGTGGGVGETPEAKAVREAAEAVAAEQARLEAERNTVVDPKAHAAIREDLFKTKDKLRALEQAKAAADQKLKEIEQSKLIEQQNFKKLWDEEKVVSETQKKRSDLIVNSYARDKKIERLQEAAIKAGMRPEVLNDLRVMDTSSVKMDVEQTDSTINVTVHDAPEFIEALKQARPWLFTTGKEPPIHGGAPPAGGTPPGGIPNLTKLTGPELLKLEKENPTLYKQALSVALTGKS